MKTTILLALSLLVIGCGTETPQEKQARIQLEQFNTSCTVAIMKYTAVITKKYVGNGIEIPSDKKTKESFIAVAGVQYYGCEVDSDIITGHYDDFIDRMKRDNDNRDSIVAKELADKIASLTTEQVEYCKAYNIQRSIDKDSTNISELYAMGLSTNKCRDIN